ncbi:serine/threonine-protein kinase [Hyalangium gracile]|uniref:serine/threonine-protein kinase n=1 Tax=Hyalangium gracile TaxID=394092 RepID=UPI001CCC292E|nr:serine/threonine-protein kinase [Hyalangium gracile]
MAENGPQPQVFGKYVLLSKLAAGGMAVTYRARLTGAAGVTKPCVIKQILPHFADDPDFVEMFVSEARVAAGLSHGNIAQVFDFGEVNGQYFIALELVHGQPLSKVLRRAAKEGMGLFPIPLALHIVSKLCDGLDYAHRHVGEDGQPLGLVHRDVSPDNVLISYEGEVKVIDFGIAKATSVVEQKTSPGVVKGKYPYFSPEQAQGRQDLDSRTDVYAAGVVLYEAVCGKRPYEGEFVAVLPRILAGDYTPPSEVNPAVSPELEDIITRALALRREDRFQTAKALSEALVELLYRDNPRFTPSLLSQLVAHLFAEELSAEGRKVELPPTFADQLSAWQSAGPASSPGRTRTPSGGGARSAGSSSRPSSPGRSTGSRGALSSGGGKAPSEGGARPQSAGGPRVNTTGIRRVSSSGAGGPRRVTNPGMPTTGSRRQLTGERPNLPEAPPRFLKEESTPPHGLPSLAMPVDAPIDEGNEPTGPVAEEAGHTAVAEPATRVSPQRPPKENNDHLAAVRAAKAKEEAERNERTQKLVRNISLGIFGVVVVLILVLVLRPKPEEPPPPSTTIWVTSTPSGATVKLNGKDVRGKTPLFVDGFTIGEANTLVLTLPDHLAWTKRFTPSGNNDPPMHADLKRAVVEEPPPTPPVATPVVDAADGGTDGGTSVAAAPAPEEEKKELDFNEVMYPARLLVLRTAFNAVPIPEYETATIELSPGASYTVRTQGGAAYTERGPTSSSLAYFLEGDMPVDDSFGVITSSPRTIKGARRMHVFAIDETPLSDNRGTVRVEFSESKYRPPRFLTFDAQKHALWLKREHQVWLHGLNPKSTYLFTVRDAFAELRRDAKGRVHRALCIDHDANRATSRPTYRLLETGKRYQLSGLETLRCTFPDTRLTDNEGALEVDLVDITNMTRKEREEYIRSSRR